MNVEFDRRRFLALGAGTVAGAALSSVLPLRQAKAAASTQPAEKSTGLELLSGYPRAFIFRQSEVLIDEVSYDEWEARMLPLNGIMGKLLAEEQLYGQRHIDYFTRFKQRHPEKAVFLHLNGRDLIPSYSSTRGYFAGHFLHRAGTRLTQAATTQDTVLHVQNANPGVLPPIVGRFLDRGPDLSIALVDERGRPDWNRVEQVRLLAVDPAERTVTVERGAYGTAALELPAGTYIATHVAGGPWSRPDDPRTEFGWTLNFSTMCPRDPRGRNAIDAYVDDIAGLFGPDGPLATLDGFELDAYTFSPPNLPTVDADGDGIADSAMQDGLNTYGLGRVELGDKLRQRLPEKILMADAAARASNPGVQAFNGAETEGWRSGSNEASLESWSTAINLYSYWMRNGREPRFTYANHKVAPKEAAYPIDYKFFRGVAAATQLTGAGFTCFISPGEIPNWTLYDAIQPLGGEPTNPPVYAFEIYDELVAGTEQRANWLGKPVRPAHRLALDTPDLLDGAGVALPRTFTDRLHGDDVAFTRQSGGGSPRLVVSRTTPDPRPSLDQTVEFTLPGLTLDRPDLVIAVELQAEPVQGYPDSIARELTVTIDGDSTSVQTAFLNRSAALSGFYFRGITPGQYTLRFTAQGGTTVTLSRLTLHTAPDVMYREFDNGVVFANPSLQPYTFRVANLVPGVRLRRLQGTPGQDPQTNDGSPIGDELTIPASDALFTVKARS